jgi:hypothetical protein
MKNQTVIFAMFGVFASCSSVVGRGPASEHNLTRGDVEHEEPLAPTETSATKIILQKPEECSANAKACHDYFTNTFLKQIDSALGEITVSKDFVFKGVKIPKGKFSFKAMTDLFDPIYKKYEKECAIKNINPEYRPADNSSFSKIYHPCLVSLFNEETEKHPPTGLNDFNYKVGNNSENFLSLFGMVSQIQYYYYSNIAPWLYPSDEQYVTNQYFPNSQWYGGTVYQSVYSFAAEVTSYYPHQGYNPYYFGTDPTTSLNFQTTKAGKSLAVSVEMKTSKAKAKAKKK